MAYIYYVDGSCSNNGNFPNEGGFSVVKVDPSTGEVVDHYAKRSVNTTNNREELKAILWVMLNHGHENPIVYSDSAYSVNTYTTWMFGWARRGWLKADKKPPENYVITENGDIDKTIKFKLRSRFQIPLPF